MRLSPTQLRRTALLTLLVAGMVCISSCRPELLVRLTTHVFHDGSLERRVEVRGWTAEREVPDEPDWLASTIGLQLAEPGAWSRVEHGPDRLMAEGFFLGVDELPPLLTYSTDEGQRENRVRTELTIEERVILKRWVYREYHGDPFSRADGERALDALMELLAEMMESELRRHLGDDLETAPARRFLQTELRSLAMGAIGVGRRMRGEQLATQRIQLWTQLFAQHGIPTVPAEDPSQFWDLHSAAMLDWARQRIAEELSTPDAPVSPDDLLGFWPELDNPTVELDAWASRTWADSEQVEKEIESHINTLSGYYGSGSAPRFRFEVSITLPGTLLGTNGTPDGDNVRWLIRGEDMNYGEQIFRVESAEALAEPIVALGARRKLSTAQLMQLVDLLWKRDQSAALTELLAEAARAGSLDHLREESDEELDDLARELADLLDPDSEPAR